VGFDFHGTLDALNEMRGPYGAAGGYAHFRESDVHVATFGGLQSVECELESLEIACVLGNPCDESVFRRSTDAGLQRAGDEVAGFPIDGLAGEKLEARSVFRKPGGAEDKDGVGIGDEGGGIEFLRIIGRCAVVGNGDGVAVPCDHFGSLRAGMGLGNLLPSCAVDFDGGFPESRVGENGLDPGGEARPFAFKGNSDAGVAFPRIAVGCCGSFHDGNRLWIGWGGVGHVGIRKVGAGDGEEREEQGEDFHGAMFSGIAAGQGEAGESGESSRLTAEMPIVLGSAK